MSQLGMRWEIDGVGAAYITRGSVNGSYWVTFERAVASLEAIESICWEKPAVKCLAEGDLLGLPEGYGFELADIRYEHKSGIYRAEVRTAKQYLGDVSAYEEQVEGLRKTVAEQSAAAAQLTADMQAAYEEGVESHG